MSSLKRPLLFKALGFLLLIFCHDAIANAVYVVVNHDNPIQQIDLADAKEFLLQKKNSWSNGNPIHYVLPDTSSPTFRTAVEAICHMDVVQWEDFWTRQFVDGKRPPRTAGDELTILRNITKDIDALGIISAETVQGKIRDKVKVILEINGK